MKRLSRTKKLLLTLITLAVIAVAFCICVSEYVRISTKDKIVSLDAAKEFECDCILVLGAKVFENSPSLMLSDRIKKGVEIYFEKDGAKLLMSGDNSSREYNEVEVMKIYAVSLGVKEEDVLLDHEGYSTSESVLNLENFNARRVIIVTQRYHLHRALFLAEKLGVEAVGVEAENILYKGHEKRLVREVLARTKDFLTSLFF